MENENSVVLIAEEVTIDEKRSSDIFLLITFKLCDNQGNLNREGVTAAFISDIINNVDKYAALPLYVDVPALLEKNYQHLTHRYDPRTGRFNTGQIGGLVNFRSEINNLGIVSQYGEARIPKREVDICERIQELYKMGKQNVSFEVKYNPQNIIVKDGVRFVDVGEGNTLTGMAIVSVPACPDANAQDMVAEAEEQAETNEVNGIMPNDEEKVTEQVTAETQAENLEEPKEEKKEEEVATAETAEAAVVHERVEVTEGFTTTPDGETFHEVHTEHTLVETVEPEPEATTPVVAEEKLEDDRDQIIAQLQARVAELEIAEAELKQLKEAQALAELQAKQEKAKAFAAKQGLDVEDAAVAAAIAELNYEAIADMAMTNAETEKETQKPEMTMASFVDIEISGKYGDLLDRTK